MSPRFNTKSAFLILFVIFSSSVFIPDILVGQRKTQVYFGGNLQHALNKNRVVAGEISEFDFESDTFSVYKRYESTYKVNTDYKYSIGYDIGLMNQVSIHDKFYIGYGTYLNFYKIKYRNGVSNFTKGKFIRADTMTVIKNDPTLYDSTVFLGSQTYDTYNTYRQYAIQLPLEFGFSLTQKFELFGNLSLGFIINQEQLSVEGHLKETNIINGRKTNFIEFQKNYRTSYNYSQPKLSMALGGRYKLFKNIYLDGSLSYDFVNLFNNKSIYGIGIYTNGNNLSAITFKPISLHLGLSTKF